MAQSANIGDSPQPPTLEREVSGTDLLPEIQHLEGRS